MSPVDSTTRAEAANPHSGVSRYIQLATLFRRRIESGHWAVGSQIPIVDDLAAECDAARATVRQALGILEAQGLIARYRAKGTFVISRPQEQTWCDVRMDWAGLALMQEGVTIEVLSMDRKGTPAPSIPIAIGEAAPLYGHWRRRHWRDGSPFHLGDVYMDQSICKRIPAASLKTKNSMRILKEIPGLKIASTRQVLTIGSADIETADLLKIPLNAPVAHICRTAVDAKGCLVFIGLGIYRGDVVRMEIDI